MHLLLRYNCISCINSLQYLTVIIEGGTETHRNIWKWTVWGRPSVPGGTTKPVLCLASHTALHSTGLHQGVQIYLKDIGLQISLQKRSLKSASSPETGCKHGNSGLDLTSWEWRKYVRRFAERFATIPTLSSEWIAKQGDSYNNNLM